MAAAVVVVVEGVGEGMVGREGGGGVHVGRE